MPEMDPVTMPWALARVAQKMTAQTTTSEAIFLPKQYSIRDFPCSRAFPTALVVNQDVIKQRRATPSRRGVAIELRLFIERSMLG
jgi:hypothetical protein